MKSSGTSDSASPAQGDILIAADAIDGKTFVVSVFPGPPQIRYRSYEDALSKMGDWAVRNRLSIWFTTDGKTFTPLTSGAPASMSSTNRVGKVE